MSEQQIAPTILWWKNKKIILRIVVTLVLGVILFIATAYTFRWDWTGLTSSPKKTVTTELIRSPQEKVTVTEEAQLSKTLWDWLQLVGIPVVLAVGTLIFTTRQTQISEANRKQQHDTEMQIAEKQQQEELLRIYFDKISDLLLNKELDSNPTIQSIVRARTLAALHMLNTERKAIVLRFLYDADLLLHVKSFLYGLDLSNTDLNRLDLRGADLRGANLERAILDQADLRGANLSWANLSGVWLNRADLGGANLERGNLSGANLGGARLGRANLSGANLGGAYLGGAYLGDADLYLADLRAANLGGAILGGANLSLADLHGASITQKQLEEAKNIAPEQLAQIKPQSRLPPKKQQQSTFP